MDTAPKRLSRQSAAVAPRRRRSELPPRPDALVYSVPSACIVGNIGKTKLYEEIAAGRLSARKCGTKTLIDGASLRAWIAGLPTLPKKSP